MCVGASAAPRCYPPRLVLSGIRELSLQHTAIVVKFSYAGDFSVTLRGLQINLDTIHSETSDEPDADLALPFFFPFEMTLQNIVLDGMASVEVFQTFDTVEGTFSSPTQDSTHPPPSHNSTSAAVDRRTSCSSVRESHMSLSNSTHASRRMGHAYRPCMSMNRTHTSTHTHNNNINNNNNNSSSSNSNNANNSNSNYRRTGEWMQDSVFTNPSSFSTTDSPVHRVRCAEPVSLWPSPTPLAASEDRRRSPNRGDGVVAVERDAQPATPSRASSGRHESFPTRNAAVTPSLPRVTDNSDVVRCTEGHRHDSHKRRQGSHISNDTRHSRPNHISPIHTTSMSNSSDSSSSSTSSTSSNSSSAAVMEKMHQVMTRHRRNGDFALCGPTTSLTNAASSSSSSSVATLPRWALRREWKKDPYFAHSSTSSPHPTSTWRTNTATTLATGPPPLRTRHADEEAVVREEVSQRAGASHASRHTHDRPDKTVTKAEHVHSPSAAAATTAPSAAAKASASANASAAAAAAPRVGWGVLLAAGGRRAMRAPAALSDTLPATRALPPAAASSSSSSSSSVLLLSGAAGQRPPQPPHRRRAGGAEERVDPLHHPRLRGGGGASVKQSPSPSVVRRAGESGRLHDAPAEENVSGEALHVSVWDVARRRVRVRRRAVRVQLFGDPLKSFRVVSNFGPIPGVNQRVEETIKMLVKPAIERMMKDGIVLSI